MHSKSLNYTNFNKSFNQCFPIVRTASLPVEWLFLLHPAHDLKALLQSVTWKTQSINQHNAKYNYFKEEHNTKVFFVSSYNSAPPQTSSKNYHKMVNVCTYSTQRFSTLQVQKQFTLLLIYSFKCRWSDPVGTMWSSVSWPRTL